MLTSSKNQLPMVLKAVQWCLTPVQLEAHWMHELTYVYLDKAPLATAFPAEVLELCDQVTSDNIAGLPFHLREVLDLIEQAAPNLAGDKRFIRLTDLVESS